MIPESQGQPRPAPRVVHVITGLGTGGAERHIQLLVERSAGEGAVVCLYERGLVADDIEAAGCTVLLLGMGGARKATAHFRLARLFRELDPEVVSVHLLAGQFWGIPAARLARVPVVVSTEHSLMDDTIEGRPHRSWLKVIYRSLERLTQHTVTVSERARLRLQAWGIPRRRMTVIENAVDFESASFSVENRVSGRQALQLPQDAVVIGAIGRLEPVKRFDTLIQAVAPILLKEDAFLVIVGEGSLRSSLEARVHELGIDHRTLLVGARSDATSLLSAFDLFVSPSNDETFGRAVLEAVGNGLPTIYAECPAIDELAEHPPAAVKLSLQIPDEVDALRLAIGKQLQHLVRYPIPDELGLRFGAGQVAEAYEELYHRLLDDLPVSRARLHRLTRTQQTRR